MSDTFSPHFSAGRFRSLTGLSDKALRLYAERAVLVPSAVDPVSGYRSYAVEQLVDGITLDLLRRARIPLDDLRADNRFEFDDHRARIAVRRAMEDFFVDLAERVATAGPADLVDDMRSADLAHWIGCDFPFGASSSPDDLEDTFTAMAIDLPRLDQVLIEGLRAEGITLAAESWTASAAGTVPHMRLAHRVQVPVPAGTLHRVASTIAPLVDATVRVTSGTLPARRELVFSFADATPTSDTGIDDTALSYLGTIAFAQRIAAGDIEPLADGARRRSFSTSMFEPGVMPEDVYDLALDA
jgi:DNA-binding transcriptional MerR regulator